MDANEDGERWGSDEAEESFGWAELYSALRGPRTSLAEDRTISPEGRCSLEDMADAQRGSRDPGLVQVVIDSPPRLQRALLDRHKWTRKNLAVTAIVGMHATIHGRSRESARAPRRSRARCRARRAASRGSTRAGPDPDPEPPEPRPSAVGGAA